MEKFPEDVRIAEGKTGGDPDIVENEEFQPVKKPNIANIFGDQTPKLKKGVGRGRRKATPSDEDLSYSRTKVIIIFFLIVFMNILSITILCTQLEILESIIEVSSCHTYAIDTKIIRFNLNDDQSNTVISCKQFNTESKRIPMPFMQFLNYSIECNCATQQNTCIGNKS